MFWMPESPRWLIEKQHRPKAKRILMKIRKTEEKAESEAASIENSVQEEKVLLGGRSAYMELLRVPSLRRALMIGVMLQVFQQLTGINTVMYYSPTILQLSQNSDDTSTPTYSEEFQSNKEAIYASMIVAATNMLMSFIAVFTIDRVGRKLLLLCSLVGVAGSLLILSIAFYEPQYSYLALIGLVSYLIFFAPGMGPVPWTINSEIYPLYVRAGATSISSCANWISNLLVSITFLSLLELITPTGTFLLYCSIASPFFFFCFFSFWN